MFWKRKVEKAMETTSLKPKQPSDSVRWFFLKDKKGSYIGCVATIRTIEEGGTEFIAYAYSTLNLDEGDRWNRITGRNKARGRVLRDVANHHYFSASPIGNIKENIIKSLLACCTPLAPTRLREGARVWKKDQERKKKQLCDLKDIPLFKKTS